MILADIAANTLAAGLVLLLMVAVLPKGGSGAKQPIRAESPIEARNEFRLFQRPPLMPPQMVMFLYSRVHRNTSGKILVDIFNDRIALIAPGGNPVKPQILKSDDGALQGKLNAFFMRHSTSNAVHLYVFSNRNYYLIRDQLDRTRHDWMELSIPLALRGPLDAGNEDRWSSGFAEIAGRNLSLELFRRELIALLSGQDRITGAQGGYHPVPRKSPGAKSPDARKTARSSRRQGRAQTFLKTLETIALWALIGSAVAFVIFIEYSKRFRKRHTDTSRARPGHVKRI